MFDSDTLNLEDDFAFLSYSENIYVSLNNVYLTRSYHKRLDKTPEKHTIKSMSDISVLSYSGEKLEYLGSISIDGSIKNQYSMDEYNGVLRVFTSTNEYSYVRVGTGAATVYRGDGDFINSASLYCIDVSDLKILSSVENFAPTWEFVTAARFDKERAYVCTATSDEPYSYAYDPVFFFDLSDLNNITYTDTGTIPGFSMSLVQMGNGYLLGLGYDDDCFKVEIYEEKDGKVEKILWYKFLQGRTASDYKAFLIDRDRGLIGFSIEYVEVEPSFKEFWSYMILRFDGSGKYPTLAKYVEIEDYWVKNHDLTRAVVTDYDIYVFNEDECICR